jgi:hypothetical protein
MPLHIGCGYVAPPRPTTANISVPSNAPSTVDELVAKQNAEYPDGPAYNVGNGAHDPIRYSGGVGIRELCYSSGLS